MDQSLVLFGLRILSALLLLALLAGMALLIYREMQTTAVAQAASGKAHGQLHVIATGSENLAVGTLFPLLPVTRIGRAASNTIVLDDSYVSTEHALLTWRSSQWELRDLDSRNGTLLNDSLLTETAVISVGDVITIGAIQLRLDAASGNGII